MTYLFLLLVFCLILGLIGVASHPSPLFGAGALVFSALAGCGVLVSLGESFIGLILLLIYLGGMLVVFAYSVALAADPYPETWVEYSVLLSGLGYVMLVLFLGLGVLELNIELGVENGGLFNLRSDISGVVLLFSQGGPILFLLGWGLLLALFVVLELVRGYGLGSLRVP
uniref:NADH-ubiquinone oxidoreductase chain 6 n=1 Tax=Gekko vittatus TaxID=278186 RepID=A1IGR0_9SAUR|nr:NADH dehydrogenase subunit 6 [Gekko vittatus]BAF44029.1 NADH dehydrogenase subunit 6 [Gekko vittatus]